MAQWKETLEPYVKVIESVKSSPLNPTVGEDLIIGAVIISDAGPSTPTLITSQKEFVKTYASKDLSQEYTDSLDELYLGDNKSLASTMWLNAYRLAGSGTLLISRASKTEGLMYTKTLDGSDSKDYIIKDSEILRSCPPFKFVLDLGNTVETQNDEGGNVTEVTTASKGWAISIKDIGVIGNRVNDNGPLYDYYVDNLYDLVQKLNETNKFYSPDYTFYSDAGCTKITTEAKDTVAVIFNTVFLAGGGIMEPEVVDAAGNVEYWGIDKSGKTNIWGQQDAKTGEADTDSINTGCAYIVPETIGESSVAIDLNSETYSGFEEPKYYASNLYNSKTNLEVRIRRYNHNAVQTSGDTKVVLKDVLDVYTKNGTESPADNILEYDFYEFQIIDPSISDSPVIFNVGNVAGRGDITVDELNESLGLIYLSLPQNLKDLGLDYYGYSSANDEVKVNLKIGDSNNKFLLEITDSDIMRAWDRIEEDERYIVEGMTDLGCTETSIQNYMANIAVNSNYFYAASTVNSTNYMVIANRKARIIQDSRKLWFGAPWDLDSSSVGYLFGCSPSVLYWETVLRNRRNNQEFAAAFGQNRGIVSAVKLAKEFKKSERQLLLTKKINTIFTDVYLGNITYWNDNVTNQSEDNVMKEENNTRLETHISKNVPTLLSQFKGYQNSAKTRDMVRDVLDRWFRTHILSLGTTISEYRITCDDSNNDDADARANRLNVKIQVRYYNSVKFIEVLNIGYGLGIPFED